MKRKINMLVTMMFLWTTVSNTQENVESSVDRHNHSANKIAILPGSFVGPGRWNHEEMGYRLQSEVYEYLNKQTPGYRYQNPDKTNTILLKNNIENVHLRRYSIHELATLLEVEYIIRLEVTQKRERKHIRTDYDDYNRGRWERNRSSSSTYVEDEYRSLVTVKLDKSTGQSIYNQTRKGLLLSKNGYASTLHYLLKRMPIYRK